MAGCYSGALLYAAIKPLLRPLLIMESKQSSSESWYIYMTLNPLTLLTLATLTKGLRFAWWLHTWIELHCDTVFPVNFVPYIHMYSIDKKVGVAYYKVSAILAAMFIAVTLLTEYLVPWTTEVQVSHLQSELNFWHYKTLVLATTYLFHRSHPTPVDSLNRKAGLQF